MKVIAEEIAEVNRVFGKNFLFDRSLFLAPDPRLPALRLTGRQSKAHYLLAMIEFDRE
jgi:hypothetical protein